MAFNFLKTPTTLPSTGPTIAMQPSPHKAFAFLKSPTTLPSTDPPPKRKLCDRDSTPSFAALATSSENAPPFGMPHFTLPSVSSFASPSAKHPVEMRGTKSASRPKRQAPAGRMTAPPRDEIDPTLHDNTTLKCTQNIWSEDQYATQISGIKNRQFVSEGVLGTLKNRLPALEQIVFDQQRELQEQRLLVEEQRLMAEEQRLLVEEQRLMIQKLGELCIMDDGKKAADIVVPEKEDRKKKETGRFGSQDGEVPDIVLPEIKELNRLKKKDLQVLCGKHGIAFIEKETRPVLISKLTALL